ncbi:hypothetical protein [Streptomyces massasporeus]|uniref:hypothetical protein n=1 Tax=Streptomyces massasporeus TaxID=67324 RepID=UPI0033EBF605
MAEHLKTADPEGRPDWFRVRRPSGMQTGLFGLALVNAADLSGALPDGSVMGVALALGAAGLFAKTCIHRS